MYRPRKSILTVEPVEDVGIDLVLVELIEHRVAAVLIELELYVLAADLQEAVIELLDALAVVTDGVAVRSEERRVGKGCSEPCR